ncbi:hypothetical protein KAT92_05395 [Candidatus Babeliales bacterium]|nr:hypothetical protein [Candidatus Babeliales bacterium]
MLQLNAQEKKKIEADQAVFQFVLKGDAATAFLRFVKGLGRILAEFQFAVDKKGISLSSMDSANVSMIVVKWNKQQLSKFKCRRKGRVLVSDNAFKSFAPKRNKDLEIAVKETDLIFKYGALRLKSPLLELEGSEPAKLPNLLFKTSILMDRDPLLEAVRSIGRKFDNVLFSFDPTAKILSLKAVEGSEEIEQDLPVKKIERGKTIVECKYSPEYLAKLLSLYPAKSKISLEFKKEYPLKVTLKEPRKTGFGSLVTVLAPRVDND